MNPFYMKNGSQIFPLKDPVRTLSTSALNGGIRTDLQAVLNINCLNGGYECVMQEPTYEQELARQIRECGIDPAHATALSTAAWTELAAVKTRSFQDLTVQAVVSGGIDHNATAPGDPAGYYEKDGNFFLMSSSDREEIKEVSKPGTINMFVFINRELTDGAMLRALMTCAEAKTAVVRELLLGSCYSPALASGSGTDGCVIVSQMGDGEPLTDATPHCALGELIGSTVKDALREALLNQTAANGARQFRLFERVKRFGITQGSLYDRYKRYEDAYHDYGVSFENAAAFDSALQTWGQNSNLVLTVSLYVHLMDQASWGLIMPGEVLREGTHLLQEMLYVQNGAFLKDACDKSAFCMERFSDEAVPSDRPTEVLSHYILLWLGHAGGQLN